MKRGFTLVEMIVVIMIMMMVMATLLPALAMMQKKADLYSANNVINVVHNVQRSYAMQFGYTGAIYGYTIRSDNTTAPGIRPWVITYPPAAGSIANMSGVDIGKQLFWNSSGWVDITDNLRAVRPDAVAGDPRSTSSTIRLVDPATPTVIQDMNIGFIPRAGFSVVNYSAPGGDPPVAASEYALTKIGSTSFRLRSTKSGYRDNYIVEISQTGIISFYAP